MEKAADLRIQFLWRGATGGSQQYYGLDEGEICAQNVCLHSYKTCSRRLQQEIMSSDIHMRREHLPTFCLLIYDKPTTDTGKRECRI